MFLFTVNINVPAVPDIQHLHIQINLNFATEKPFISRENVSVRPNETVQVDRSTKQTGKSQWLLTGHYESVLLTGCYGSIYQLFRKTTDQNGSVDLGFSSVKSIHQWIVSALTTEAVDEFLLFPFGIDSKIAEQKEKNQTFQENSDVSRKSSRLVNTDAIIHFLFSEQYRLIHVLSGVHRKFRKIRIVKKKIIWSLKLSLCSILHIFQVHITTPKQIQNQLLL